MSRKKSLKDYYSGLPERIREIRGELTQKDFAVLLGVNQGTVHKYEKGVASPGAVVLKKIADHGERTVEWLLHGEDYQAPLSSKTQEHAEPYQAQRPEPLEAHLFHQVMAAVEDFLKASKEKPTRPQYARLFTKVYNECAANFLYPDRDLVAKTWPLVKFPRD